MNTTYYHTRGEHNPKNTIVQWFQITHGTETIQIRASYKWNLRSLRKLIEEYFHVPYALQTFIHQGKIIHQLCYNNRYVLIRARPYRYSVFNLRGEVEFYDMYTNSTVHDLIQDIENHHVRNKEDTFLCGQTHCVQIILNDSIGNRQDFLYHKKIRYVLTPFSPAFDLKNWYKFP